MTKSALKINPPWKGNKPDGHIEMKAMFMSYREEGNCGAGNLYVDLFKLDGLVT